MDYYEHLFVGEKAKERRYGILQGLREGRLQPEVYVIMPPLNGNNVLEIVGSSVMWFWCVWGTGGFCLWVMIEGVGGS